MTSKSDELRISIQRIILSKSGRQLTPYVGLLKKIDLQCTRGHTFKLLPTQINKGQWCPECEISPVSHPWTELLRDLDIEYTERFRLNDKFTFDFKITSDEGNILLIQDSKESLIKHDDQIKLSTEEALEADYRIIRISDEVEASEIIMEGLVSSETFIFHPAKDYSFVTETEEKVSTEAEKVSPEKKFPDPPLKKLADDPPRPKAGKVAVGYIRCSLEVQKEEGETLAAQEKAIISRAAKEGYHLRKIYKDEGISGKNLTARPGIRSLLAELQRSEVLIVYSLSRLSRETKDALYIQELIEQKNCSLIIIDNPIDTRTAEGQFQFALHSALGKLERQQIGRRTSMVMNHMSSCGELRGKPPYGYMRGLTTKSPHVHNPAEMEVVGIIREMKELNPSMTFTEMARELIQRGIPTRAGKEKSKWWSSTVKRICQVHGIVPMTFPGLE